MLQLRYTPRVLGVNSITNFPNQDIHGLGAFIATMPGAITIADHNGIVLLNNCPLVAGQRLELTMYTQGNDCTITLTGGAGGTLLYW
jgi:hypothetical protein